MGYGDRWRLWNLGASRHVLRFSGCCVGVQVPPKGPQSGVTRGGHTGVATPNPSQGRFCPLQSRLPLSFPQVPPHCPPINGTSPNWEAFLGTLGAAGQEQSDSGAGGDTRPPKISAGMERGVPGGPEATGRGCGRRRLRSSVGRAKGVTPPRRAGFLPASGARIQKGLWGVRGTGAGKQGRGTSPRAGLWVFSCPWGFEFVFVLRFRWLGFFSNGPHTIKSSRN